MVKYGSVGQRRPSASASSNFGPTRSPRHRGVEEDVNDEDEDGDDDDEEVDCDDEEQVLIHILHGQKINDKFDQQFFAKVVKERMASSYSSYS